MTCKHNRIIKKIIKKLHLIIPVEDINTGSKIISEQYEEIYFCSHCGQQMKVVPC